LTDLARVAAMVLAGVFAWAGVAKLWNRQATSRSFAGLGLPAPASLALVVPATELGVASALVAVPPLGAWAALALLVVFTVVIIRALATGVTVPCACFGSARSARAVSSVDVVRNACLAAAAVLAAGVPADSGLWLR